MYIPVLIVLVLVVSIFAMITAKEASKFKSLAGQMKDYYAN